MRYQAVQAEVPGMPPWYVLDTMTNTSVLTGQDEVLVKTVVSLLNAHGLLVGLPGMPPPPR